VSSLMFALAIRTSGTAAYVTSRPGQGNLTD
jgi:hypothetical protein